MSKDICMAKTANGCANTATTHRDGKPVCNIHAKSKKIVWKTHQLTIDGALDEGAMTNPTNIKNGVARIRAAVDKKKEETMYTAYVIARPIITKDEEGNPTKAVFPVIQESSKMRSIEDHIESVKKNFMGWDSIHYIFFKDEEGNKLYYPRKKNQYGLMEFQEMTMKQGLEVVIRKFRPCNRCSGTGVYTGPSGMTRFNAWGFKTKECFACGGSGEVR